MILAIMAWILIWAGYSTTYFSDNGRKIDRWRSLLPLVVGLISLPFITFSPLNLMLGYVLAGMIGAFFSTRQKIVSWWWAMMFASPLLFLMTNPSLEVILNLNWVIAGSISLLLMGFFLIQPGVLKSISFNSFFCSNARPYEGMFNVPHEAPIFGITGTRPTGLARYSAIASLVMLCLFIIYNTWYTFLTFLIFTFILLFSKGKTEMVAFIISMGLLVCYNLYLIPIYLIIIVISSIIVFGNIPYKIPDGVVVRRYRGITMPPKLTFAERVTTLGGRIKGVWIDAVKLIKKSPWFGYGFGAERYLLKDYKGDTATVDNTLLNALLQSGIIGTIFFLSTLLWVIMGIHTGSSLILLECISVGIFILIRGLMQSFSNYSADWLFLIPIMAYLQ